MPQLKKKDNIELLYVGRARSEFILRGMGTDDGLLWLL